MGDWRWVLNIHEGQKKLGWVQFPLKSLPDSCDATKILSPLETGSFLHFILLFLLCPCFLHMGIIRTFSPSVLWWSWETLAGNISTVAINMLGKVNLNWKRHLWSSFNLWMEKKGFGFKWRYWFKYSVELRSKRENWKEKNLCILFHWKEHWKNRTKNPSPSAVLSYQSKRQAFVSQQRKSLVKW